MAFFLVKLTLDVQYPDDYPDVLPELSLELTEGEVDDEEIEQLLGELRSVVRIQALLTRMYCNSAQGEENVGMAMTFTLVSHLREQLAVLVKERAERRSQEEAEKERLALEVRFEVATPRWPCLHTLRLDRRKRPRREGRR